MATVDEYLTTSRCIFPEIGRHHDHILSGRKVSSKIGWDYIDPQAGGAYRRKEGQHPPDEEL